MNCVFHKVLFVWNVTQQIDALEIMGINSANYLILPKITAMVTVIPVLVTFSIFAGIIGAFCTCWFAGVMNAVDLEYGFWHWVIKPWFQPERFGITNIRDFFIVFLSNFSPNSFNIKGKDVVAGNCKYYLNDLSFKNFLYLRYCIIQYLQTVYL